MRLAAAVVLAGLSLSGLGPALADEAAVLLQAAQRMEARRADAWLASMQAQLQLTPAQQAAFASYAEAIRAQAELRAEHRTSTLYVNTATLPPAPEALAEAVTRLKQRMDALARVQTAAGALYQELSAQQRTAFDFLALTGTGIGSDEAG